MGVEGRLMLGRGFNVPLPCPNSHFHFGLRLGMPNIPKSFQVEGHEMSSEHIQSLCYEHGYKRDCNVAHEIFLSKSGCEWLTFLCIARDVPRREPRLL